MNRPRDYAPKFSELRYIVLRNLFLLTNGILAGVVVLLVVFGNAKAGLFLGIILALNVSLGLFQDIRAWLAIRRLQLLTAPRVSRLGENGREEIIFVEEIRKGDRIAFKTGDQVPGDGVLITAHGIEINAGLITGESDSLPRFSGERLLAGSVVTSGSGILRIETVFNESRIARMTEGIRKHSVSVSPIERSVAQAVAYSIYILIAGIVFVFARGALTHESALRIVTVIGAMTSAFVPQGLVFAVTLFFAYGAVHLFRRNVLLQEVNATEKLGRIRNLCMDKTGTLTENELSVEEMYVPEGVARDAAKTMIAAYIGGTKDSSDLGKAIKRFVNRDHAGEVAEILAFSSWRQYGAVRLKAKPDIIFAGSPGRIFPHLGRSSERDFLNSLLGAHAHLGKRLVCAAHSTGAVIPKDISAVGLSLLAVFVFRNNLREGIRATVDFFQKRGVRIRILSGDNPETARAIAAAAGINAADKVVSGREMDAWKDAEFEERVRAYSIFAGILPEQKEKIVAAFRKNGFTAMVGDGANDALAIKEADLGIAMFDGAAATRQLASVVLMNNSFAALPGGVELADSIIRNLEIFASMFSSQTLLNIFFFIIVSLSGYQFPFTPLNITFINYLTVGIPGLLLSYWTIRPSGIVRPINNQRFLKRILPFAAWSAVLEALCAAIVFALSPHDLKIAESNILLILTFIALGFAFFICAPAVYREKLTRFQKRQIAGAIAVEFLILIIFFRSPFLLSFFAITPASVPLDLIGVIAVVVAVFCYLQYKIAERFTPTPESPKCELGDE